MPSTLKFPTMLRKMWSGGEVQQWLDNNAKNMLNITHGILIDGPGGQAIVFHKDDVEPVIAALAQRTGYPEDYTSTPLSDPHGTGDIHEVRG